MLITFYEDWMNEQVVDLFVSEYEVNKQEFSSYFSKFYDTPFQKEKSIRLVALEDNLVIGFQSFFYWPYKKNNQTFHSLQSGNSLIHREHRGKGVFSKLLNFIDENKTQLNIDFIIGFPVDASFNSFIRKGWVNVFNLKWYIKKTSIFSVFFPLNLNKFKQLNTSNKLIQQTSQNSFKLYEDNSFVVWRKGFQHQSSYFNFEYEINNQKVQLCCKVQVRKKVIKEVIIGNVITTSFNLTLLKDAVNELCRILKKRKLATIVSIALNENSKTEYIEILKELKFINTNKKINFIVYALNCNQEELIHSKNWEIYRGDIDTW